MCVFVNLSLSYEVIIVSSQYCDHKTHAKIDNSCHTILWCCCVEFSSLFKTMEFLYQKKKWSFYFLIYKVSSTSFLFYVKKQCLPLKANCSVHSPQWLLKCTCL